MIENTIEIHAPLKKLSRKQRKLPAYVTSIFVGRSPTYFWIFDCLLQELLISLTNLNSKQNRIILENNS